MDITGTRSRRDTQNEQLRAFAETVGINETSRIERPSIANRESVLQADQQDTTVTTTGAGSAATRETGTRDTEVDEEQVEDDHGGTRESKQSDFTIDRRGNVNISAIDSNRIKSAMRKAGSIRKRKSVRFGGTRRNVEMDDDYDELTKLGGFDNLRTRRLRSQQIRDRLGLSFDDWMSTRQGGLDSINATFGNISAIGTQQTSTRQQSGQTQTTNLQKLS